MTKEGKGLEKGLERTTLVWDPFYFLSWVVGSMLIILLLWPITYI